MIETTNEVVINQSIENVWPLVGYPTRWHTWRDAMSAPALKREEGAVKIGSTFDYKSAFLGRTVEAEFKVLGYVPDRQISAETDKPVPVTLAFRCEKNDGKTRVIQETKGQVGGFFGMAEPLVKPLMQRSFQKSLDRLKAVAERG